MTFKITFLSGSMPAQKHFYLDNTNTITSKPYPNIKKLTSTTTQIESLKNFLKHLKLNANKGNCLLKGNLTRPIKEESRAGLTDDYQQTQWLCLDIDGLPDVKTPEDAIKLLPVEFHGVSYIAQLSSSMFIDNSKFSGHLFFILEKPASAELIKDYISCLNISIPAIKEKLTLNPANTSLHKILDPVINQNSRIIFIAPPAISSDIETTINHKKQIWLESKEKEFLTIDFTTPIDTQEAEKTLINNLREIKGLPARRTTGLKFVGSLGIETKPGRAHVTSAKTSRGFTYINLNGGDSWGYYFPTNNPEIVRNFKDEPNYYLKDLDPDAYTKFMQEALELVEKGDNSDIDNISYFACNDLIKDKYCYVVFNNNTKELILHYTTSLVKIKSFLKLNNQPIPEDIPNWTIEYDFHSNSIIDYENQTINLYQDSKYIKNSTKSSKKLNCPPTILNIISHVMNNDEIAIEHFLNWLAVIVQHKIKTKTAWVFSGTQGTGKNLITGEIITPILGNNAVTVIAAADLEKDFNGFMDKSLLVIVDEIETDMLSSKNKANSNIKKYITEPTFNINKKFIEQTLVRNYSNFIFTANKHDSVIVDDNDRRFNIAPRQKTRLKDIIDIETINAKITSELQNFTNYLVSRKASIKIASSALENDEKSRLTELTEDSNETILKELVNGNLEFFINNKPDTTNATDFAIASKCTNAPNYEELIKEAIESVEENKLVNIPRLHIQAFLYYISGVNFKTPHKCTKFLAQKGYQVSPVRYKGTTIRGLQGIEWKASKELITQWNEDTK